MASGAKAWTVCQGLKSTMVFLVLSTLGDPPLLFRKERFPMASRVVQANARHRASRATSTSRKTSLVLPRMRRRKLAPGTGAIGGSAIDTLLQVTRPEASCLISLLDCLEPTDG